MALPTPRGSFGMLYLREGSALLAQQLAFGESRIRVCNWLFALAEPHGIAQANDEISEHLAEPFDLVAARGEAGEGLVDVAAQIVADGQATGVIEASVDVFHHPAVGAEFLAALDAAPGEARHDHAPGTPGVELIAVGGPSLPEDKEYMAASLARPWLRRVLDGAGTSC